MKIAIIGSGNVATFYALKLYNAKCQITQIYSRALVNAAMLAKHVGASAIDTLEDLKHDADVYIVAIKDDALESINNNLQLSNKIVIHCSGTKSINALESVSNNRGIIWPLYSILKNNLPQHDIVPLILDANNEYILTIVERISIMISSKMYRLNDQQRAYMHLNAVLVNNFTNHLYGQAQEIASKLQLPFEALLPIIHQTVSNANNNDIYKFQTGPAIREDYSTLNKHIDLLERLGINPDSYVALSKAIIDKK